MKEIIHLFYVGSYSHLIVSNSIITEKRLPLEFVYFVTYRGIKLPECYTDNLLYDESIIQNRKLFFLKNYCRLKKIFKDKDVYGYFPFPGLFPVFKFFKEYVFFEEGLSAYDSSFDYTLFHKRIFINQLIKQSVIALFLNKTIHGLYYGRLNSSPFAFDYTLVGLTNKSYKSIIGNNCKHEVVHFSSKPLRPSSIKNSFIVVMDYTHATDRMDSTGNYLRILSDVLKDFKIGQQKVYIKLHPDNFRDIDASISVIKEYLKFIDFTVIDESLEDIALSNQNNTFIGSHSTILFYAPIYGDTNKSISFARVFADRDNTYSKYIQRWGGAEGLKNLFTPQVDCI